MFTHVSQDFLVRFLLHSLTLVLEEGFNRSQGKGRHVCLGGIFYSIPCCASYYASVHLEEKDEFNRFFQINRGKTASMARN